MQKAPFLFVLLAAIAATRPLVAQQPNPSLVALKAAAEADDPQSQDKLADIYRTRGELENAVAWYRRSAPSGIINSQYQLAHQLLSWVNSPSTTTSVKAMHFDEALPLLIKAAGQGHKGAQLELGQLYCDGKLLAKDLPEAYKWFCLAADGTPVDLTAGRAKSYRDGIILKMSQDQITEGNQRLAKFQAHPEEPAAMPEPAYLQNLKLQGITGTASQRLAIINGRTLAAKDTTTLKIDTHPLTLHCLSVTSNSATVAIDGFPTAKTLTLH